MLNGNPFTMALGIREYGPTSKGADTWEMTKRILTGSDMANDDFFKSYAGTEYTYEKDDGRVNIVKMSHFAKEMSKVMQLGFVMSEV